MPKWNYNIELNKVIADMNDEYDLSNYEEQCPNEVLNKVSKELIKAPPLTHFADRIMQAKTIAEFNRILSQIYDKADQHRVWCGF